MMNQKSRLLPRHDGLRYILWLLVAYTAFANRRHYRMFTTWLPHLLTNSLALLLPDIVRRLFAPRHKPRNIVEGTLITMARDNPAYVYYVAPLALGYIVSHPRFNIYKGAWGDLHAAGFGLDTIPHTATAFAFSALVADTFETMGKQRQYRGLLANLMRWGSHNPERTALALLALITLNWELGEYQMHQYEMARFGDPDLINMQWSMADTWRDVIANLAGWGLAVLWRHNRRRASAPSRRASLWP